MKLAAILVGLAIAASVAWFASEQHYSNCVDAAEARNLVVDRPPTRNPFASSYSEGAVEAYDRRVEKRRQAIDGCSRLP